MSGITNLKDIIVRFYNEYTQTTPQRLKIVDAYLLYIMLTGIIQFAYCCLVGTFPFNSFLSGFISSVGSFVLAGKKSPSKLILKLVICSSLALFFTHEIEAIFSRSSRVRKI